MILESYYTKHMYFKDIARWEADHEAGDVYDDEKAQATFDENRRRLQRCLQANNR